MAARENNTASGEEGVLAEMLKMTREDFRRKVTELLMDVWIKEEIPDDWKTALIHPQHKMGPKAVNNYRGISQLPVSFKIVLKVLQNQLELQTDPGTGEYQGGFRKGRSCQEQILSLKLQIKYCMVRPQNLYISFVDFRKVYASVHKGISLIILREWI
ncbi:uncharacterized protein [Halyomorpha halys]|uniref:uncharacterized protein n=1 Tax=Halyomorpha halys TaxID=286706 RepID=UPI0034D293B5